jgi:hypothetical protein
VVGPDCAELPAILDSARRANDPQSGARRELKAHLLGPDEPPPLARFVAQVDRLVAS